MLLRVYAFGVLCWDLLHLILGCGFAVLVSMFHIIRPPQEKSVRGEIVLITGTGRGIGRELALQMTALGAIVICVDIDENSNSATVKEANKSNTGGTAIAITCDVTSRDQVLQTAKKIKREVGRVSIVMHCCGIPSPHSLVYKPIPEVRKTMDISIMSHFWILEAFLPDMMENNYGHLVALTSVAGLAGSKQHVSMCASQFAVQGLMESLSEELRTTYSSNSVYITLAHVYPFIVSKDQARDIKSKIPSYFGIIEPKDAAKQIISGMRRNYLEISVPGYLLYIGKLLRILPRKASILLRELLDTGVDIG